MWKYFQLVHEPELHYVEQKDLGVAPCSGLNAVGLWIPCLQFWGRI